MTLRRIVSIPTFIFLTACSSEQQQQGTAAAAPTPAAPPAATQPQTGTEGSLPVSDSVVSSGGTSFVGGATASVQDEINVKQWAKDGGGIAAERAPAGQEFLIVQFPETRASGREVQFLKTDFALQVNDSGALPPYGVTPGGGYEDVAPGVFQKDVYMTTYQGSTNRSFAVAFLIPEGVRSGSLRIKDATLQLRW